jgi:NDP-sugar pyrophosphorylase family protein
MSAIILVGGEGRRLRDVAPGMPKPLVKVAGHAFLHWVTRWAAAQGESHIVLAAHHLADQVQDWAAREKSAATLQVVVEPEPLGTGGALMYAASQHKDDYYLAVNGDSATFVSLKPAQDWLKRDPGLDGVVIAKKTTDASRFGSLDIGVDGLLTAFHEKRPGEGWINAGIYLLKAHLLSAEPRAMSIERDCFPRWLAGGARFGAMAAMADFLDIGTPQTLAEAGIFIEANRHLLDDPARLAPVQPCV